MAKPKSKLAGKARGHHGQQIHYLIWVNFGGTWSIVGAISGGSAVFASRGRDTFFSLDKLPRPKRGEISPYLSGIVHNTLFRLECNEFNLATVVLSRWRKQITKDWKILYGADVYGFETYVDESSSLRDQKSNGGLYRADNWVFVGNTAGSAKDHVGVGLTGGITGTGVFRRRKVSVKLGFCKWNQNYVKAQFCEYKSSWRGQTPEEKTLAKKRSECRKQLTLRAQEKLKSLREDAIK